MSLYPELDGLSLAALIDHFESETADAITTESLYYSEVALKITQYGEPGVRFLFNEIEKANNIRLRAILGALGWTKTLPVDPGPLFAKYFTHSDPMIVAEAIDALRHQGECSVLPAAKQLCSHGSPYVVGAALRYVTSCDAEGALPMLLNSLASSHPVVRQNAVDLLDEIQARDALPHLRRMLNDADPDVREAVNSAIRNFGNEPTE